MVIKETPFTLEMYEASQVNEVKIGGTVENMNTREGGIKNEETGERWADSYYIDFAFQGGKNQFRVTKELFETVEIGKRYQFVGRSVMVTPKEGRAYLTIEPIKFEFLF